MRHRAFHNAFHGPTFNPEQLALLDRAFNDAADALTPDVELSRDALIKLGRIVMAVGEEHLRTGGTLAADADASAITVEAIDRFEAVLASDQ